MKKLLVALTLVTLSLGVSAGFAGPPPANPPCEKGKAGTTNPNCDHNTSKACDHGKAADHNKHCPPPSSGGTTCSTGGLAGGATQANSDKNEDGAVSGPIHNQLEPAVDGLAPVVHEVNCDIVVSLGL